MVTGALLRRLMPAPPLPPRPRPIVQTNEPEGPRDSDGAAFYNACPMLELTPDGGFPVLVVRGRRAL